MIELLHDPSNAESRRVADALATLTVAHSVTLDPGALPEGTAAPVIRDGDRVISGAADVSGYLRELEVFMAEWGRFQGDSCYIGGDGCVV
jgi:hypothetical protein